MARLTLEQARQVAELAALELDEAEAQAMCHDLTAILEHFAALERVDVEGVEPTFHPIALPGARRPDVVHASGLREELLKGAPEHAEGGFAVPRVLDGES